MGDFSQAQAQAVVDPSAEALSAPARPVLVVATGSLPMRRLLAQRLADCGVDIVEAVDVDDTLAALRRCNPTSVILSSDLGTATGGLQLARALGAFACRRRLPIVLLVENDEVTQQLGPLAPVVHTLEVHRFRSLNVLARTVMNLHHRAVERVRALSDTELLALENGPKTAEEIEDLNAHQAFLDDAMDLFSTVVKKIRDGRLPGPMMPELLSKVQDLLSADNVELKAVATFVEQHQALAARMLSMANSAMYSRGTVVRELDQAVSRLGIDECASLMRTLAALGFLRGKHPGVRALIEESLRRAYFVGLVGESLARSAKHPRPSLVHTAGLFHNVGATFLLYTVALMHEKGEITDINTRALATMAKSKTESLNQLVCRNMRLPADIETIYDFSSAEAKDPALQLVHRAMWIADLVLDQKKTKIESSVEAELLGLSVVDVDGINHKLSQMLDALATYSQAAKGVA